MERECRKATFVVKFPSLSTLPCWVTHRAACPPLTSDHPLPTCLAITTSPRCCFLIRQHPLYSTYHRAGSVNCDYIFATPSPPFLFFSR